MNEHAIQSLILDWLKLHRYFHFRNNSGGFRKGKHFVKFGSPGSPDIFVLHKGKFYGIEVKDHAGKQSTEQIEFQYWMEKNGGVYILARSLEDVEGVLK